MVNIIHAELSYAVRGVMFDVYNKMGPMLAERFYQEAVRIGLTERGISAEREKSFEVYYRGTRVGLNFVDVWVEHGKMILELKVAPEIAPIHAAQAISYLKVTDADLAIVVNFGAGYLQDRRLPNYLRDKLPQFTWERREPGANGLYPELTNRVLEAVHRVHVALGPGFMHRVYRRAIMVDFQYENIAYEYIREMPVHYGKHLLGTYTSRVINVEDRILVEPTAVQEITDGQRERLKKHLKRVNLNLGLLANFNRTAPQIVMVRV